MKRTHQGHQQAQNHACPLPPPLTALLKRIQRLQRQHLLLFAHWLLPLAWWYLFPLLWPAHILWGTAMWFRMLLIFVPFFPTIPAFLLGYSILLSRLKAAMGELEQREDVRVIGGLIEIAARPNDPSFFHPLSEALVKLLPQLRAGDGYILTEHHYRLLYKILANVELKGYGNIEPLSLAILQAAEQMRDGRAASLVERLAKRGRTDRIRNEARRILPGLQECRQRENAPATLLRPSRPIPQDLLHPSRQPQEAAPEQLLRAGGQNE